MIPRFSRSRCRVWDGTFLPERHFPRTPPLNGRADRSARGSAWAGRRSGGCSPVPWPDPRPSSGAPGWCGRGSWRRRRRRASGRPLGRRPSWRREVTDAGTSRRAWRVGAAAEAAAGPQCSSHPGGPAAASARNGIRDSTDFPRPVCPAGALRVSMASNLCTSSTKSTRRRSTSRGRAVKQRRSREGENHRFFTNK